MKFLLLQYIDESAMLKLPRDEAARMHGAYSAFVAAMKKEGVLLANHGLRPTAQAATLRVRGGHRSVVDGPYAETKEQLGGYFLIDVADREAALAWAERCPAALHGTVELRPVWE